MKKSLSILMLGVALSFGSVYAQDKGGGRSGGGGGVGPVNAPTAAPNPAVAAAQTNLDQAKAILAKAQAEAANARTAATNADNAVKAATDAVAKATNDLGAAKAAASKPAAPVAPAAPAASTAPTGIKVLMAAYGLNCKAPKPDVMAHLAAACNGKSTCTYTVDHKLIGDTAPGCAKDYVVDYACARPNGNPPMMRKTGVAPEASGKTVQLVCDTPAPAAQPMDLKAKEKACLDLAKTQAVPGNFMGQFMGGCMAPPKTPPRIQACQTQAQAIMHLVPAQMGGFMNECTSRP